MFNNVYSSLRTGVLYLAKKDNRSAVIGGAVGSLFITSFIILSRGTLEVPELFKGIKKFLEVLSNIEMYQQQGYATYQSFVEKTDKQFEKLIEFIIQEKEKESLYLEKTTFKQIIGKTFDLFITSWNTLLSTSYSALIYLRDFSDKNPITACLTVLALGFFFSGLASAVCIGASKATSLLAFFVRILGVFAVGADSVTGLPTFVRKKFSRNSPKQSDSPEKSTDVPETTNAQPPLQRSVSNSALSDNPLLTERPSASSLAKELPKEKELLVEAPAVSLEAGYLKRVTDGWVDNLHHYETKFMGWSTFANRYTSPVFRWFFNDNKETLDVIDSRMKILEDASKQVENGVSSIKSQMERQHQELPNRDEVTNIIDTQTRKLGRQFDNKTEELENTLEGLRESHTSLKNKFTAETKKLLDDIESDRGTAKTWYDTTSEKLLDIKANSEGAASLMLSVNKGVGLNDARLLEISQDLKHVSSGVKQNFEGQKLIIESLGSASTMHVADLKNPLSDQAQVISQYVTEETSSQPSLKQSPLLEKPELQTASSTENTFLVESGETGESAALAAITSL